MKSKKLLITILCVAMFIILICNKNVVAEELNDTSEVVTENEDDTFDDEADLIQKFYMDEAVAVSCNTENSYNFIKGKSQLRSYKITVTKDAILHYCGKAYADDDADSVDEIYIYFYDEDGNVVEPTHYGISTGHTDSNFVTFDDAICLCKGTYYLAFRNSLDSIGATSESIGTDRIEFELTLTELSTSEKEINNDFSLSQAIKPGKYYGTIPYNDGCDVYKIIVTDSGKLQFDIKGISAERYLLNDGRKTSWLSMHVYNSEIEIIDQEDLLYSDYYECNLGSFVFDVEPGIYYIQLGKGMRRGGYYEFTVNFPNKTNGTLATSGIFCASNYPSIQAGISIQKSNEYDDVEYKWVGCDNSDPEHWFEISPWTKNNNWMNWTPEKSGGYVFVCYARVIGNEEASMIQYAFGTEYHKQIKGICQMPYTGEGGGYLIGIESYDNPNHKYQYEMLILDCNLYMQGKDAWVYTTGRCGADGNCLWTVWQPVYGYYWTLFRIYDSSTGELVDEACYGFENVN